jgi:integrase
VYQIGSPLVLLPHDCRRVFASEHLNNNTPVHVIQSLLGHASPDTVMIALIGFITRLGCTSVKASRFNSWIR